MNFHAVYTRPRREFEARDEISKLGYETFLPIQTRSVVIRRKVAVVVEGLFTRYLFARFAHTDPYGAIKHCRGVEYIIENAGSPTPVPNRVIEVLRMAEKAGAFDFTQKKSKFRPGDDVEVQDGPFMGIIAKVQSASPRKRIKILMNLLGSEVPIEIEESSLKNAPPGLAMS